MLAFITGLSAEASLVSRLGCPAFAGGGTPEGAARQAEAALAGGATALISFGLAGGLDPSLEAGDLLIPTQVFWQGRVFAPDAHLSSALGGFRGAAILAGDAVAAGVETKSALWETTGASAIDLESGVVAELAARRGVAFAVLRAVCDPAWRALPPAALAALDGRGMIGIGRVASSVLRKPHQIPSVLTLAWDARRARKTLIDHVAGLMARDALQPWLQAP
jgi:adenosylhomocysteine nucleosidase